MSKMVPWGQVNGNEFHFLFECPACALTMVARTQPEQCPLCAMQAHLEEQIDAARRTAFEALASIERGFTRVSE